MSKKQEIWFYLVVPMVCMIVGYGGATYNYSKDLKAYRSELADVNASWEEQHNQMMRHAKECRECRADIESIKSWACTTTELECEQRLLDMTNAKIERCQEEIDRLMTEVGP